MVSAQFKYFFWRECKLTSADGRAPNWWHHHVSLIEFREEKNQVLDCEVGQMGWLFKPTSRPNASPLNAGRCAPQAKVKLAIMRFG